ncbi:MAG: flagellin, partial [Hylemonella sp.]
MYINSASSQALYAAYAMKTADTAVSRASERLSTGLRINSAADDPSGLVKANNLKTYLGSYSTSLSNINDGIAMNQIADKGLSAIYSTLSNMYTLAVSSYTADSSTDSGAALLAANQSAFESYQAEIDSLASSATYNGKALLSTTGGLSAS